MQPQTEDAEASELEEAGRSFSYSDHGPVDTLWSLELQEDCFLVVSSHPVCGTLNGIPGKPTQGSVSLWSTPGGAGVLLWSQAHCMRWLIHI